VRDGRDGNATYHLVWVHLGRIGVSVVDSGEMERMRGLTEGRCIDVEVRLRVFRRSRSDQRSAVVYRVCQF